MNTVFITGGASGLGAALAKHYASKNYSVYIVDIHDERGEETVQLLRSQYGVDAVYRNMDVTNSEAWQQAMADVKARWGHLNVLVNNAGVGDAGAIDEHPLEVFQWVVDINLMGVVKGCHYGVPLLKESQGTLINVASMAGLLYMPELSAYNATKAAVVAMSETLQGELEPYGVHVSVLCPAFFKTNLIESMKTAHRKARSVQKVMDAAKLTAEDIAQITYDKSVQKQFYIMPHAKERWLWRVKRYSPWLYRIALRMVTGKPRKKLENKTA